jgi:hypothetical protein
MSQPVPPETVALARRLYTEGKTNKAIMAETGIASVWLLYQCLDGKLDDGSGQLPPPLPRRRDILGRGTDRKQLVRRLWRNAERQVDQIEQRLKKTKLASEEFERDARSLAMVVRTVRELSALDAAKRSKDNQQKPNDAPVPRNIDDLRRELARKLKALADEVPEHGSGPLDLPGAAF